MKKRSKTRRAKSPFQMMRFRKKDPAHNLLAAVQHYVHANGGTVTVIGGIQTQQWPEDGALCFRVAVKVLGTLPPAPAAADQKAPA